MHEYIHLPELLERTYRYLGDCGVNLQNKYAVAVKRINEERLVQ